MRLSAGSGHTLVHAAPRRSVIPARMLLYSVLFCSLVILFSIQHSTTQITRVWFEPTKAFRGHPAQDPARRATRLYVHIMPQREMLEAERLIGEDLVKFGVRVREAATLMQEQIDAAFDGSAAEAVGSLPCARPEVSHAPRFSFSLITHPPNPTAANISTPARQPCQGS